MRIYAASSAKQAFQALAAVDWEQCDLGVLVSFHPAYFQAWKCHGMSIRAKSLMLDSGAYTAWTTGAVVDYDALCAEIRTGLWQECVALDVIGDWKGSWVNALRMKNDGLTVMPVFHYGEPWQLLMDYCANFQKVGLSCLLGEKLTDSFKWLDQCFSRAYPHKFHSFGWTGRDMLLKYPFHSADAATWAIAAARYGRYKGMKGLKAAYGSKPALDSELKWLNELQRICSHRWAKEMARWDTPPKETIAA